MGCLCCCCRKKGPPEVVPDDGCWESFKDFVIVGRRRDRMILLEQRRMRKWKVIEQIRAQDYLIAGAREEAYKREEASDKIFEPNRALEDMNKDVPEQVEDCCNISEEEGGRCEELWKHVDLKKLTYDFLYECCERHELSVEGSRLMLETRINKWRRAPEIELERLEELERKRKIRHDNEAGTVYAFGKNEYGQLGLGSTDEGFVRWPRALPTMKNKGVSTVYAGYDASVGVAVNDDGDVFLWGDVCGQIADPRRQKIINNIDNSALERLNYVPTIEETFRYPTDVEIVREEVLERFANQHLEFSFHQQEQFGMAKLYDKYGEYLNGRAERPTLSDLKPYLELSGDIERWKNMYAGWMEEDMKERERPPTPRVVPAPFVLESLRGEDVQSVAIGKTVDHEHVLLLTVEGGDFYSAGTNDKAQLGYEVNEVSRLPMTCHKRMQPLEMVACGQEHAAAVTANGALLTWGHSKEGKLGHGILKRLGIEYPRNFLFAPGPVRGNLDKVKVLKVACGRVHTVAVTADCECFSWGSGAGHRLGHGSLDGVDMPKRIEALDGLTVTDIACAGWYSIAMVEDAPRGPAALTDPSLESKEALESDLRPKTMVGLYSWGSGTDGQLGQGSQLSEVPKPILTLLDQEVVPMSYSCGEKHAALLSEEGQVWTWGNVSAIGRPIPLRNDVVSMNKARGGYVVFSPPRRLREPLSDPFPGVVKILLDYPIGNAVSVACGLDFTLVATRRCYNDPPPAQKPPSPRRGGNGKDVATIPRREKKELSLDVLEKNDSDGHGTIVDIAAEGGKPDILMIHLQKGADVDMRSTKDSSQDTALIVASRYGNGPSVEVLLRYGANVHLANKDGRGALEEAVEQKRWGCLRAFLNHRSYKHAKNLSLQCAAKRGYNDVVALALEHGAYVDYCPETDETLETPVMWAARNGHKETVRLLYENGADIEIKNFENERAIDFARIQGHGDIADMLQRWTRKKNKKRLLEMKRKSVIVTTPRDEDGDNDKESIRRMRKKMNPPCNQCLLQNWKERKERKEGWCPGFLGHASENSRVDVFYCQFCRCHFKEHRWPLNHPIYLEYVRKENERKGIKSEEDAVEIDIPTASRGGQSRGSHLEDDLVVEDAFEFSEDYLQNLAEQQ